MALLEIRDLFVELGTGPVRVAAVNGVRLELERGEVLGVVGESGAGKTMVARSVAGILPAHARTAGQVLFDGRDVLGMSKNELDQHRGSGAAMCFQQPRRALNPVRRVGLQLKDRLANRGTPERELDVEALGLFNKVGIQNPADRLQAFPHELSGGMAQRVMISLALGCTPQLLVADEPTTGLDVTLTRSILSLLRKAATEQQRAVLIISHDLAAIAEVCDRICVMYAGTVVETGPMQTVLSQPAHPYTVSLLAAAPDISGRPIQAIRGGMPTLHERPASCPFVPRCAHARERCGDELPVLAPAGAQKVACFFPVLQVRAANGTAVSDPRVSSAARQGGDGAPSFVVAKQLEVVFGARFTHGGFKALHGVDLTVRPGETLGVVGESGCGKTTLGRTLVGLLKPTAGSIRIGEVDITTLQGSELRRYRRHMQMVFQDPIEALNPRRTVEQTLRDSMALLELSPREANQRVLDALVEVGLDPVLRNRRRNELSGGQAQRVGIARALVVDPDLLVFDEPTSALDVTVQAQILELIESLRERRDRSYVFISHDLAIVSSTCDSIVVLYLGRVVEQGPIGRVFARPLHPYTRALLSSAPSLDATREVARIELKQDLETSTLGLGCPLSRRCPFALARCVEEEQILVEHDAGHKAACWRAAELETLVPAEQRIYSLR